LFARVDTSRRETRGLPVSPAGVGLEFFDDDNSRASTRRSDRVIDRNNDSALNLGTNEGCFAWRYTLFA